MKVRDVIYDVFGACIIIVIFVATVVMLRIASQELTMEELIIILQGLQSW